MALLGDKRERNTSTQKKCTIKRENIINVCILCVLCDFVGDLLARTSSKNTFRLMNLTSTLNISNYGFCYSFILI